MKRLDALLESGVQEGLFSRARAVVLTHGQVAYDGGNAPHGAEFDLASLTKVMVTTALVRELRLPCDAQLSKWLPGTSLTATIDDLLFHRAGLPAHVPFFLEEFAREPLLANSELLQRIRRHRARERVLARAQRCEATGQGVVYSDVGFILLGAVLEVASRLPLDVLFARKVAAPLGLAARYRRLSTPRGGGRFVPTGSLRPRPAVFGSYPAGAPQTERGVVDDDNTFVLDGVAGHAGLFGTAVAVARFGQAVLEGRYGSYESFSPNTTSHRACGFMLPTPGAASCGERFGPRALGHLGFTGTSLWIDFDRELVVALLTDSVAVKRSPGVLKDFRPRFHEAVIDAL